MKKWFLHILLLAGLFGTLTTSCSQEEGLEPQASDEKVQVMFTIALDGQSARSRATWGSEYDDEIGDKFENSIDPDQLFVKLTIDTQTYDVENVASWKETNGAINEYKFIGEVDVTAASLTGAKVMVFANMTPAQTIGGETFNANYSTFPGTGVEYIPMWGVHTITADEGLSLTPGSRTELRTPIYLLRAMAKVEVNLNAEGYTLTNVSLNKYNKHGNSLPSGASAAANTKALHYDDETGYCFNPNTTEQGEELAFTVTDNHLVFYLPEVANPANDELMMTVTLKKGNDEVNLNAPYLYFRNYEDGNAENAAPFDIVRNHWYQYNITAVNDGFDLEFDLNVAPWTLVEKTINYESETISITIDDEGLGWSQIHESSTDTKKYMLSSGADAIFKFRIDTPLYCEYYVDLSGDGFSIETDSEICVDDKGQLNGATEVTVTIKAIADGEYEGILRIFVKEDNRFKEVPGNHRYTIIKNYK